MVKAEVLDDPLNKCKYTFSRSGAPLNNDKSYQHTFSELQLGDNG